MQRDPIPEYVLRPNISNKIKLFFTCKYLFVHSYHLPEIFKWFLNYFRLENFGCDEEIGVWCRIPSCTMRKINRPETYKEVIVGTVPVRFLKSGRCYYAKTRELLVEITKQKIDSFANTRKTIKTYIPVGGLAIRVNCTREMTALAYIVDPGVEQEMDVLSDSSPLYMRSDEYV